MNRLARLAAFAALSAALLPTFVRADKPSDDEDKFFIHPLDTIGHLVGHQVLKQQLMSKIDPMLNDPPPSRVVTHRGRLAVLDGGRVRVLYLEGSPYEMGVEQSLLIGAEYKKTLPELLGDDAASRSLDAQWTVDEPLLSTDQREEFAGLAQGLMPGTANVPSVRRALQRLQIRLRRDGPAGALIVVRRPLRGNSAALVSKPGMLGGFAGLNSVGISMRTATGNPIWVEKALRFANQEGDASVIVFAASRVEPRDFATGSATTHDGVDWLPLLRQALAAQGAGQ
jgi:hypothetical protein